MTAVENVQAVNEHLSKGTDIDFKNKEGLTALHITSLLGQYEVAKLLIRKGANVNIKGNDGGTALHTATFLGQYKVAKLLIQSGADVNARNNNGKTVISGTLVN